MQIIRNIPGVLPEPCVATIGFFDGVHMGHRFLIEQVRELAAARGLRSALITFPIHPRKVMNADYRPDEYNCPPSNDRYKMPHLFCPPVRHRQCFL